MGIRVKIEGAPSWVSSILSFAVSLVGIGCALLAIKGVAQLFGIL